MKILQLSSSHYLQRKRKLESSNLPLQKIMSEVLPALSGCIFFWRCLSIQCYVSKGGDKERLKKIGLQEKKEFYTCCLWEITADRLMICFFLITFRGNLIWFGWGNTPFQKWHRKQESTLYILTYSPFLLNTGCMLQLSELGLHGKV